MAEITRLDGTPITAAGRETKIVLTYDNHTGHLGVDGDLQNVDRVLNVLTQAHRYFDAVYRFQKSQEFNAEIQQARQVQSMIARPH